MNDQSVPTEELARTRGAMLAAADLLAVLLAYERWEADLILCGEAWEGGLPRMTQELYDRWMEIQRARNAALAKARGPA